MVERPARPTMAVRLRVPAQDMTLPLADAFGAVRQCLNELGEEPVGPAYVAYPSMGRQNLDVEMGFPVARPLRNKGGVKASEIPAGKYATCLHAGPYGGIDAAYAALSRWLAANGQQTTGAAYEMLLTDPLTTPAPAMEIQILLRLKEG